MPHPAPPPDDAVPAAWSAPLPRSDGWRGFGDPALAGLVDDALAANLDLAKARAALAQARALRDVAAAGSGPTVGTSASMARSRALRVESTTLKAGLDASWEPDAFGAQASAVAAAEAGAQAGDAALAATRLAVAGEVAVAYLQWQGARVRLAIARDSAESQARTLELVRWRVAAGLATALDAQQAEAALAQTRAQLPALQQSIEQGGHAIAVLLGQPPAALAGRLAAVPVALPATPSLPAAALPAEVLRRRPDVRAAELKVVAQAATLAQREAERLPRFSIGGSLGLQAASWSALGGPAAVLAGVSAAVSWPLVDGGAAKAQVAAQQAVLDGARADYRAAVLAALQDVEDNLVAIARGGERVAALASAADAADRALSLARQRYRAGLIDFTTLLDTQRSALGSHDALAAARTDLLLAHVRLAKALGGAWPAAGNAP